MNKRFDEATFEEYMIVRANPVDHIWVNDKKITNRKEVILNVLSLKHEDPIYEKVVFDMQTYWKEHYDVDWLGDYLDGHEILKAIDRLGELLDGEGNYIGAQKKN